MYVLEPDDGAVRRPPSYMRLSVYITGFSWVCLYTNPRDDTLGPEKARENALLMDGEILPRDNESDRPRSLVETRLPGYPSAHCQNSQQHPSELPVEGQNSYSRLHVRKAVFRMRTFVNPVHALK